MLRETTATVCKDPLEMQLSWIERGESLQEICNVYNYEEGKVVAVCKDSLERQTSLEKKKNSIQCVLCKYCKNIHMTNRKYIFLLISLNLSITCQHQQYQEKR